MKHSLTLPRCAALVLTAGIVVVGTARGASAQTFYACKSNSTQRLSRIGLLSPTCASNKTVISWSASPGPASDKILLTGSDSGAAAGIWVMESDGSNPVQLTTVAGDRQAVWSPNREKIAFAREVSGGAFRIFIMNADGSGVIGPFGGDLPSDNGYIDPGW
jgi:hypothetical protein